MKHFTIDAENNITIHSSAKEAETVPNSERFSNEGGLAKLAANWPAARLVEIWNSLPGETPVKKFKDRATAVSRIWKAIQTLGQSAPTAEQTASVPEAGSNLTIEGGSSIRSFWYGNAVASFNHRKWGGDWNTARDIFQVQIYSHGRGLPQMPFYGIGPDTARSDLTDFRERDFIAGVSVINPLQSWLSVGGAVDGRAVERTRGNDVCGRCRGTRNRDYVECCSPDL